MANSLTSNWSRKLMRIFLPAFESARVLSKTVDTQLFQGAFNPSSGANVDIKRPHQYLATRTSGGDLTSATWNSIISGKASATVQNYITIPIPWSNYEEALELDQLEKIIAPAAEQAVIELETSLYDYMVKYSGLSIGTPGTAVNAWSDVAAAGSLMKAIGVPGNDNYYVMNPFTAQLLSTAQHGLYAGENLVKTAWQNAVVSRPVGGMNCLTSACMSTRTAGDAADRAGALTAAPTQTYAGCKDSMTQTWAVTGFTASSTIKCGEILQVTGKYFANPKTHKTVLGTAGTGQLFRAVVTADVTLGASGVGNLVVSGPAIYEANGQYNNISAALATSDVVTVLGSAGAVLQPNLFYQKDAFSIAFVKLPKLYSQDTIAVTKDGISIRCTKYSDGTKNTQYVRFDLLPAFGCLNPFWAGQGFGL